MPADIAERRKRSHLYSLMHTENQETKDATEERGNFKGSEFQTNRNSSMEVGTKYFKMEAAGGGQEKHVNSVLRRRLLSLKQMSVDEVLEPKVSLKRQKLMSKTESLVLGSPEASQTYPVEYCVSNSQSQVAHSSPSRYLHMMVFDRVIFMGSYIVTSRTFMRPKSVRYFLRRRPNSKLPRNRRGLTSK